MSAVTAFARRLLDGFWFVPGAIALAHCAVAELLLEVDRRLDVDGIRFAFGGDAQAARNVLSTIAGSLITVAGLTFSITIVVLTLVSSQYTPRTVRSFLADRVNQTVAGTFVGIFAYCLIVLGAVRSSDALFQFVPVISVSVALLLALGAVALLVVFVHHMGDNIQASKIVARVAHATLDALDRVYPEPFAQDPVDGVETTVVEWRRSGEPGTVSADKIGYVQEVDLERVTAAVDVRPLRIHVAVKAGEFVTEQTPLVETWPADAVADDAVADRLRAAFVIAKERDLRQDVDYGLRQLADIALKGLSPGVNDPTTAVVAIGFAFAILERLVRRSLPSGVTSSGDTVVAAAHNDFASYVETAVRELGPFARQNPRVIVAALEGLHKIAVAAPGTERRSIVARAAADLAEHGRAGAATGAERDAIHRALERVVDANHRPLEIPLAASAGVTRASR